MVTTMDVLPAGAEGVKSYFVIRTKCFYENAKKAFELMEEILFEQTGGQKRLKEIIGQIYTNMKPDLTNRTQNGIQPRHVLFFSLCKV